MRKRSRGGGDGWSIVEALLKHCWSCMPNQVSFCELKVVLRLLPDAWGPYPARYLVPLLVIPGQKAVALAVLPMRFPALWGVMVKSSGCKTCQGFSLWAASDHGNLPETCSPEEPRSPWLASKFQGSHGGQLGAMHYDIGLLCCMPSDQVFQWLKHIMSGTHFISACAQNVHEASVSKPSGKRPYMEFLCCRQSFGTHLFCSPVSWEAYWWCSRLA